VRQALRLHIVCAFSRRGWEPHLTKGDLLPLQLKVKHHDVWDCQSVLSDETDSLKRAHASARCHLQSVRTMNAPDPWEAFTEKSRSRTKSDNFSHLNDIIYYHG
jgi:hypothetical protein